MTPPFEQLAAPARRALAGAGIKSLKDLTKLTEAQLKQLHGIGPNAWNQLRSAMKESGLNFAREK